MQQIQDSDINFAMIASNTFDRILQEIQTSNLNFQLQVSPFSAQISLKKSLVKDRKGSYCLQSESSMSRTESEILILQNKNLKIENDLNKLYKSYERAVNDCEEALGRIKTLEENCENKHIKDEANQKFIKDNTSEIIADALRTENENLRAKIKDQNEGLNHLEIQ